MSTESTQTTTAIRCALALLADQSGGVTGPDAKRLVEILRIGLDANGKATALPASPDPERAHERRCAALAAHLDGTDAPPVATPTPAPDPRLTQTATDAMARAATPTPAHLAGKAPAPTVEPAPTDAQLDRIFAAVDGFKLGVEHAKDTAPAPLVPLTRDRLADAMIACDLAGDVPALLAAIDPVGVAPDQAEELAIARNRAWCAMLDNIGMPWERLTEEHRKSETEAMRRALASLPRRTVDVHDIGDAVTAEYSTGPLDIGDSVRHVLARHLGAVITGGGQ